jgi:hypothetical protein
MLLVFLAGGCATPVGVKHVDEETAYRALDANILSSGEPSAYSTQLLERNALVRRYRNDPEAVLAELYSGLGKPDESDRLFALAELSFAHAEATDDRPTTFPPPSLPIPFCSRKILPKRPAPIIRAFGLPSICTTKVWPRASPTTTPAKSISLRGNSRFHSVRSICRLISKASAMADII